MDNMTSENISPVLSPESKPQFSRQEVLGAFKKGFDIYDQAMYPLKEKLALQGKDSLSKEEKDQLSDFYITMQGWQNATGEGKKIPINWQHEGIDYFSKEGVPVEGLIGFLEQKISDLKSERAESDGIPESAEHGLNDTIADLEKSLNIISSQSVSFTEARRKDGVGTEQFSEARKAFEANARFEDPLRKSTNPDEQVRQKEDWAQAEAALERRMELVLPPETTDVTAQEEPKAPYINYKTSHQGEAPRNPPSAENKRPGKPDLPPRKSADAEGVLKKLAGYVEEQQEDMNEVTEGFKGSRPDEIPAKPYPSDNSAESDLGVGNPLKNVSEPETKKPVYDTDREGTYSDLDLTQQEQSSNRDKAEGEDFDDITPTKTTEPPVNNPPPPTNVEPPTKVEPPKPPVKVEPPTQANTTVTETAKPPQTEEIDEAYFKPGTVKEAFYQDRVDDANAPKLSDIQKAREAKKRGEMYPHQKLVDDMDVVESTLANPQFQAMFPRNTGESDTGYRRRLLDNLSTRLRFHGDYATRHDQAYQWLQTNLKDAEGTFQHQDEILMATEALSAFEIQAANEAKEKAYKQKMFALNQGASRRSVLSAVSLTEDERYATGDYLKYLTVQEGADGKLTVDKERMAAVDLAAYEMVGTVLGDIPDPTLGEKPDGSSYTYNEQFKSLSSIAQDTGKPQVERDAASRKLAQLRERFTINTLDVLKHRHENNPYREDQKSAKFQHDAFEKLYAESGLDLSHKSPQEAFDTLMKAYEKSYESYHGRPMNARQKERFNLLKDAQSTGIAQDLLELSLKGGELVRRRTEELPKPPHLDKVPTRIYRKTFMDKGVYRGPAPIIEETPVTVTLPTGETQKPKPAPGEGEGQRPGETETAKTPGTAPVDTGKDDGKKTGKEKTKKQPEAKKNDGKAPGEKDTAAAKPKQAPSAKTGKDKAEKPKETTKGHQEVVLDEIPPEEPPVEEQKRLSLKERFNAWREKRAQGKATPGEGEELAEEAAELIEEPPVSYEDTL